MECSCRKASSGSCCVLVHKRLLFPEEPEVEAEAAATTAAAAEVDPAWPEDEAAPVLAIGCGTPPLDEDIPPAPGG